MTSLASVCDFHLSVMHEVKHRDIRLVRHTQHIRHTGNNLVWQAVYIFKGENYTDSRVTVENNLMFSHIITTNIQNSKRCLKTNEAFEEEKTAGD